MGTGSPSINHIIYTHRDESSRCYFKDLGTQILQMFEILTEGSIHMCQQYPYRYW